MSGSGRNTVVVSRDYRPEPGAMTEALQLLLKTPVREEDAQLGVPDDPERRSDEIRARTILHDSS